MRSSRTKSEEASIKLLSEMLLSKGKIVSIDDEIVDKPDAVLVVDGKRVAVECTIFTPQNVMLNYFGFEWIEGRFRRFYLPKEPHMWIRKSINRKSYSIDEYKIRSSSEEVWLIAHAGFMSLKVGELEPSWEVCGFAAGVRDSDCHFDRVYVINELEKNIVCIYSKERGYCIKDIDSLIFPEDTIPIEIISFGRVKAVDLGGGKPGIRINVNDMHDQVFFQPLDGRYSIDYEKEIRKYNLSKSPKKGMFATRKA